MRVRNSSRRPKRSRDKLVEEAAKKGNAGETGGSGCRGRKSWSRRPGETGCEPRSRAERQIEKLTAQKANNRC